LEFFQYCQFSKKAIFNPASGVEFIRNHQDKMKAVLITHLSEGLRQLAYLGEDNLQNSFLSSPHFLLKHRIDFSNLSVKNVTKKKESTFQVDQLKVVIADLKRWHGVNTDTIFPFDDGKRDLKSLIGEKWLVVRVLFQLATGIRVDNSLNVHDAVYVKKLCLKNCKGYRLCQYPSKNCLVYFVS